MKRKIYFVFCGYGYYPGGGFEDYQGSYCTMDEAMGRCFDILQKKKQSLWEDGADWFQIVNIMRETIIREFDSDDLFPNVKTDSRSLEEERKVKAELRAKDDESVNRLFSPANLDDEELDDTWDKPLVGRAIIT